MVVKYKDRPLEFWDARTLTFIRDVVSNPPTFSCVVCTSSIHRCSCAIASHSNKTCRIAASLPSRTVYWGIFVVKFFLWVS